MKRFRQFILQGSLILLPVVLLFAVLEATARIVEIWNPPMQVDVGQGFDKDSLLFHPVAGGFMETNPDKEVSFQKQQFKMPKPPHTMRIFALGGSSVNYLEYEFSLLEQELQKAWSARYDTVEIINCGGLSYGTHRLVLIMAEILHYEPDLVMVYSGHNEFEELQQLHLANLEFATAQRTLGYSALYRFLRDMRAQKQIGELQEARQRRELATALPDTSKTWAYEFTAEEMAARMDAYRDNLAAIITSCRNRGIPIIIGTVPSNLVKPNLPGDSGKQYEEVLRLYEAGQYEEGAVLGRNILKCAVPRHQSSDMENGIIRQLAEEFGVPLADVESAIIEAEPHHVPGETLFSDHCHLNEQGNRIWRKVYHEKILETIQF